MGSSSGSGQIHISGSEGELQEMAMKERKRKRMESNRESAKRSRMRKQKHLDDLMSQVVQLRNHNNQIFNNINVTTQHYLNLEADNSVLRAQVMELTHRLQSLNDMLSSIHSGYGTFDSPLEIQTGADNNFLMNPWMYLNQQPIMAAADAMFQY